MNIGNRFKLLRKSKNLTQTEFAKELGISQGTLSDIESNKFKPSVDTILSTCQYFNVSADWILTGKIHEVNNNEVIVFSEELLEDIFNIKFEDVKKKENKIKQLSKSEKTLQFLYKNLSEIDQEEIVMLMIIKNKRAKH